MKKLLILLMAVFSLSFSYSQSNLDQYQGSPYPENPEFDISILQLGDGGDCGSSRRNLNDLSNEEMIDLRECMMAYLSQEDPGWNGSDIYSKYLVVNEHTFNFPAWHFTNSEDFFTGHRQYIEGMESFLLENGCSDFVPLPFWYPENEIPSIFMDAVVPGFPALENQNPSIAWFDFDETICDAFIDQEGYSAIDQFATEVEDAHGPVHGAIGGTMNLFQSSGAAIFWFWHAHVDDIYRCYQEQCQCEFLQLSSNPDECTICVELNSLDVTGNNTQLDFYHNGEPVEVNLDDDNCIFLPDLEYDINDGNISISETGDICSSLLINLPPTNVVTCSICHPVKVIMKDCTVCFETERTPDSIDESVLTFTNNNGNIVEVGLDSDGCILRDLFEGLPFPPGSENHLSIDGVACGREDINFEMPLTPVGVSPKWGRSCIEIEMTPENPVRDQFNMDIENLGQSEDVSIYRMDTFTGQREEILPRTRLNKGEEYRVTYNASNWQVGSHLIHVYYGEYLIADKVIKQ